MTGEPGVAAMTIDLTPSERRQRERRRHAARDPRVTLVVDDKTPPSRARAPQDQGILAR
jgi:hypothetical protein